MTRGATQEATDRANTEFWDELCGSKFAREIGVTDSEPASIARFDQAYFDYYPFLLGYLPGDLTGARVLEIGLGYGSLSQKLAERGADYNGLDIAAGPVAMVRERLRRVGVDDPGDRVQQGSGLEVLHPDASFDHFVSIGCLHHTGDLPRAVAEAHRVLKRGGTAVVMLYNRWSFRRAVLATLKSPALFSSETTVEREVRRVYDQTLDGEPAPIVDYTGVRDARRLFSEFSSLEVRRENFDDVKVLPQQLFLGAPARIAGVDLYITATK